MSSRAEAAAAVDQVCPRCGAPREPSQEFCLECGFQLPEVRGRVPSLRRRWIARFGWYPGDWIWVSLLTFVVAAAGAAVAIAATSGTGSGAGSTVVAPPPPRPPATTAPAVVTTPPPARATTTTRTAPATTHAATTTAPTTTTTAPTTPNGKLAWPTGQNGWTNVLMSFPADAGPAAADAAAAQAARHGLPQVGVLDSSSYASLHPGYDVVFSGIYATSAEADAALASAHAGGFAGAYTRQISG